jgi:hypothetical protein
MNLIKALHAEGKRFEWNVTEREVHISGNMAWIAYVNKGSIMANDINALSWTRFIPPSDGRKLSGSAGKVWTSVSGRGLPAGRIFAEHAAFPVIVDVPLK